MRPCILLCFLLVILNSCGGNSDSPVVETIQNDDSSIFPIKITTTNSQNNNIAVINFKYLTSNQISELIIPTAKWSFEYTGDFITKETFTTNDNEIFVETIYKYQNNNVKHDSNVKKEDIDYFLDVACHY